MATKTFYLLPATAAGTSNFASLQDGGSAPADATTATGWTVAKIAASNYSNMERNVERASGTFGGTALPNAALNNTLGDAFRTQAALSGEFASGTWTFNFPIIAVGSGGTQDGRLRLRLYRGSNQDGSGATEITGATQLGGTITNLTTTEQTCTVSFNPGTITLSGEYLFVQLAWEITGAGGNNNCDVLFRENSGATITTTDFTASGQNVSVAGEIASAEAFDSPSVTRGAVSISVAGEIASAEAFESPTITQYNTVSPDEIPSAEAFGNLTITTGPVSITISDGIATGEAFGTPAFGVNIVNAGDIASQETFGSPTITRTISGVGEIASAEAFGSPTVTRGAVTITIANGIASAEAFGNLTVTPPTPTIRPASIDSAEEFGPIAFSGGLIILNFPHDDLQDSKLFNEIPEDFTDSRSMEGGYDVTRPLFTGTPLRTFNSGFTYVTDQVRLDLESFWNSVRGGSNDFYWRNPADDVVHRVRFTKPLQFRYVGKGTNKRWDVGFEVREVSE